MAYELLSQSRKLNKYVCVCVLCVCVYVCVCIAYVCVYGRGDFLEKR